MKSVQLARGLTLPAAELATKVTGAFGGRGSGKTALMGLVIEQLLDAKIQVVVLDPIGIHYALRLQADGKHPSRYQIPVLGGAHGDLALEPTAGAVVGRALALSHDSCVLDISKMHKGERIRFSAAFFEAFYEGKKENPSPVLLCLEEAQNFAPQLLFKGSGQEQMLGAIEDLAAQGRNFGCGLWLNTLRPQKVNKEITSLMDIVFGFKLTGVHERKAVRDWLQEKGATGRDELDGELPGLQPGHAFVWSPSAFGIFGKFHLERKTTYDAGATPLYARAKVTLKALDLDELKSQMAEVVEQGKANDPRALKARIAELERELLRGPVTAAAIAPRIVEKSVLKPADIARLERLVEKLGTGETLFSESTAKFVAKLAQAQQGVIGALESVRSAVHEAAISPEARRMLHDGIASGKAALKGVPVTGITYQASVRSPQPHQAHAPVAPAAGSDSGLSRCARALLGVLAVRGVANDSQLSALSGYRKTSSGFANALSELRTKGLIDGGAPERRGITEAGRAAAGPVEALPTGPALLDYWRRRLSKAEAAILSVVYLRGTADRETISRETGYSQTSSGFANAISGLRTLDLVHGPNGGDLTIADVFKEACLSG